MFLILLLFTTSAKGVAGIYDYHLVRRGSYNMIPTTEEYGLLDINGGTVYYDGVSSMSTTMSWMCRMLGYQSYYSYRYSYTYEWQQNYPVRYVYLECAGSVVPQCRYQAANNYDYSVSLWLRCNSRNQLGDSTSFYLVDKDKQHTQKGHGILMYNGGTVSGNKFDDTTAELVCRIMGYNNFMSWNTGRRYHFQDNLPIRLSDLNCLKSEEVFPFCVYGTDTTNKTHEDDIWLWCALPTYNTFTMVCPPGQRRVSSKTCVQCEAGTYSPDPNESSSCLSCPAHSTSLAGSTFCSCKEGTYMNSAGDQCLTCPEKSTSKKGSTFCSCVAGTYLYSDYNNCVKCPYGTVSRGGSMDPTDCIPCREQSTSLNDGKACSCKNGYGWEWISDKDGSCKACPANFYKDKDQGTCLQCPHEATSLPRSQACQCSSGLSWDGSSCVDCASPNNTAGVCECLPGTFWSEESGQCEPCPQNHFSEKFSSVCKMCPLLTVSEPQSAECTSCSTGNFWENYTCTECPDNHVGNGATCSVCPKGTSPSKDKTICQKSDTSIDPISVGSMALAILTTLAVLGNIFFTWRERRARIVLENLQLTYQAESSTSKAGVKVKGRRCMCPSCPCSEVPKPALPKRGATVQQDDFYANFS